MPVHLETHQLSPMGSVPLVVHGGSISSTHQLLSQRKLIKLTISHFHFLILGISLVLSLFSGLTCGLFIWNHQIDIEGDNG
ncbi:hypothetical protein O6P43_029449 [Quillaja saponaria]|uniref:Uncharacterized protein n=1 Tax=Quillaja saponaria TaxID=32244 RepID=A0AAD7PBF5_QUISA|nr:hypothetical protein O6P43_029449 [Quillaja saponaria]